MQLEYFNSQSCKSIYLIFKLLSEIKGRKGKQVLASWTYDGVDENIEEFFETLNEDMDLKVALKVGS